MMERRQFPRLVLSEEAYATDAAGRTLGKVEVVGGGGMLIHTESEAVLSELPLQRRLRVTVVEPKGNIRHSLDVEVRYHDGRAVGVEFQ